MFGLSGFILSNCFYYENVLRILNIIIGGFMHSCFNYDSEILTVDTGYTSPLIIVLEYYNKEEIAGLIRKKVK